MSTRSITNINPYVSYARNIKAVDTDAKAQISDSQSNVKPVAKTDDGVVYKKRALTGKDKEIDNWV